MTQFSYLKPLHGVQLLAPNTPQHNIGEVRFHLPFAQISTPPALPLNATPLWQLIDQGERYTTQLSLYKHANDYQLNVNCEGTGSFVFNAQHMQVHWQPGGTGFEHYIQSTALACWLELQGVPCIHANAMRFNDEAFLFIAPSRTGKSTLTSTLLEHGFQMMTDDMAALHQRSKHVYQVFPSWPKIRLWPDSANSFIGTKVDKEHHDKQATDKNNDNNNGECDNSANNAAPTARDLTNQNTALANQTKNALLTIKNNKKVHEKFAKQELEVDTINSNVWSEKSANVKAIYILERSNAKGYQCAIEQIKGAAALMLLLQNSMLANAYVNLGLEAQRLQWMSTLLGHIKVYKITYNTGMQYLPKIGNAIKCHTLAM